VVRHEVALLGATIITDEGLKELKGLKSLKVLYLQKTKITDAGERELKAALPSFASIADSRDCVRFLPAGEWSSPGRGAV